MRAMYSSLSSPTHHIFFPPRLQVVALQQHPNGLSPHSRNQFAFDNLFGQQPHRPTRPPFRRRRTDHGDNLLALALVQSRSFARPCGVEQRSLQPFLFIPLANLPDSFGRKAKIPAHQRRGLSLIHLPQSQGTQCRAYRLQAAAQQVVQLPTIPHRKLDLKPHASAHDSAIQPDMARAKYQYWLPIHAVMILADKPEDLELLAVAQWLQPDRLLPVTS